MNTTAFTPAEDEAILSIAMVTSANLRTIDFWNTVDFPNRDGHTLLRRYLLLNTPIKKNLRK